MKLFSYLITLVFCFFVSVKPALAQAPVANFTVANDSGCSPFLVQFVNTSTGNNNTYQWDFGDGSGFSTIANPGHTYGAPGVYTVTLIATNSQGSNTKTHVGAITVLSSPIVNFSANVLSGCPPLTVTFTDLSNPVVAGPAIYGWGFGNGSTAASQHATYTFTLPGLYPITHTVKNSGGCITSLVKNQYINVYTPPVADFSFTTICTTPGTTTFTTSITGIGPYTYNWNYGDGTPNGTTNNPTHTYATSGTYNVTLIVTDVNGCKDTVVKQLNAGGLLANFNASPTGCKDAPIFFQNISTGASSYIWDFGDASGTFSTTNPVHVYNQSGTFVVTLIASDLLNLCVDTIQKTITIHNGPAVSFTKAPTIPCSSSDTIYFTNTSPNAVSYLWDFGDGGTSTVANPWHLFSKDSVYKIKLTVTDSLGCSTSAILIDTIYKVVVDITRTPPSGYCMASTIQFGTNIFATALGVSKTIGLQVANITWNFGDGSPTSSVLNPSHNYSSPGTYLVSATGFTDNGCPFTDTVQISIYPKPTALFTASSDTICSQDSILFTNLSTNALNYTWYFYQYHDWIPDDYTTASSPNLVISFNYPRTYYATLVAFNGACSDTFTLSYPVVVLPPNADFGFTASCDTPGLVHFFDTSFGGITSRLWSFGDGSFDTSKNPSHLYTSLTNYVVTLTVFNNHPRCSTDVKTRTVGLTPITGSFTTSDTILCVGDTVYFTATFSDVVNGYGYLPNYPNPFTLPSNYNVYTSSGVYSMTLRYVDHVGCQHYVTKQNYIKVGKPQVNFIANPYRGCAPHTPQLIENGGNMTGFTNINWFWDYGDGTTANVASGTSPHTYTNPGRYDVKVTVTDNQGCVDSAERLQYVEVRKMYARFNADDTTACVKQNIFFNSINAYTTPVGIPYDYYWDFGDGTSSTAPNPVHAYTTPGTYTVKMAITDSLGCTDTLIRSNYIDVKGVTAAFTASDTYAVCPPLTVQFTNNSIGATQYNWIFGDGGNSIIPNPMNIYSNPGLYTVRLIATNSYGCKDTAYKTINVLGYAGSFTYTPTLGCNPLQVSFNANLTNVASFMWDFSDGVVQNAIGNTISHTYTNPGKYVPKILFSDGSGCLNSSTGLDTIYVDDVFGDFATSPLCINTPIQFMDTSYSVFSSVTKWSWNFNNGQYASISKQPTVYFNTSGTFPIVLTVTNANGCKDTALGSITVYDLPQINAGLDTTICIGDSTLLKAQGAQSYTWSPSNSLSCAACTSTMAHPSVATRYIVTGTDINGCKNKDSVNVFLKTQTTSLAGPNVAICKDSSIELSVSGAQRYLWKPATGLDNDTSSHPIATPFVSTAYTVYAYEGSCLPDSHQVKVTVYPLPTVNAGPDETLVAGTSTNLNAKGSSIASYLWTPANGLSCETCSSPIASPTVTTTYVITVRSGYGCIASDTVVIHVLCDQSQLFIPNTFSPNGDGDNDIFYPRGVGLREVRSFRVFNRWGEMVFERKGILLNDAANGWDGTYKGKTLSPDVYVYVLDGICEEGGQMIWKGDINLLR